MALWEILRAQRCARSDDLFAMLAAEKLNGGRMRRNTIIIQHGKGEFKVTAEDYPVAVESEVTEDDEPMGYFEGAEAGVQ